MNTITAVLSADQALSTANQWYTLASVSLGPGTWLITAVAQVAFTGADGVACDIFDGSTGQSACKRLQSFSAASAGSLCTSKLLALDATTTISMRARSDQGTSTVVAQGQVGSGNTTNATQITASQVTSCGFEAVLDTDVALTNASQWYTGPSLSLDAGTWLAVAVAQYSYATATFSIVELFDGVNTYCFDEYTGQTGDLQSMAVASPIVLPAAATLTLRLAADAGNVSAIASVAGEPSTRVIAVQV